MSFERDRSSASQLLLAAALALFSFVLVAGSFEHHDLACHLKSRTHCTSCVSSQVVSGAESGGTPGAGTLPENGRPDATPPQSVDLLLPARTTGRSPPA